MRAPRLPLVTERLDGPVPGWEQGEVACELTPPAS
jgi:hypothetical protein